MRQTKLNYGKIINDLFEILPSITVKENYFIFDKPILEHTVWRKENFYPRFDYNLVFALNDYLEEHNYIRIISFGFDSIEYYITYSIYNEPNYEECTFYGINLIDLFYIMYNSLNLNKRKFLVLNSSKALENNNIDSLSEDTFDITLL